MEACTVHASIKVHSDKVCGFCCVEKTRCWGATQWSGCRGNQSVFIPLVNIYPRCPRCSWHTRFFPAEARKPSPAGTTSTSHHPGPPPACPVVVGGGKHTCGKTKYACRPACRSASWVVRPADQRDAVPVPFTHQHPHGLHCASAGELVLSFGVPKVTFPKPDAGSCRNGSTTRSL